MNLRVVPALFCAAVVASAPAVPPLAAADPPAAPDFRALLRDALFDEEASRDLDRAAAGYEALLAKWSEQRSLAASAVFRLAEVRRKQGRRDDAVKLYQRLVTEFPDIDPEARLSRENLTALGVKEPASGTFVSDEEAAALARVQKLATESPDLLTGNEFTEACEKGLLSVVKFLHSKGVRDTGAGMAQAAGSGRLAICTELLAQSPPADHLARGLAQSLAEERLSVFKLLLEKGGDASAIGWNDSHGGRPLLTGAILWENEEMVDLLLAHKAAANAPGSSTAPLFAAAFRGNAAIVKSLLELGADPNAGGTSPDGNAPPRRAGVGVSTPDRSSATSILSGCTPLHAAVFSGSAECVSLLLAAKADPNAANEAGWTPLHSAAKDGRASAIELLLAAGANPNGPPAPDGEVRPSPLWLAIDSRQPGRVAALLKGKADPNLVYADLTPAAHAITLGDEIVRDEILTLLLANGADPTLGSRSAIREAPTAALRVKLLRDYQYPRLAAKPAITLSYGDGAVESSLAAPRDANEKPAPLATAILAWHDRGGWTIANETPPPDWSAVRLYRKGGDGKMTATLLPIKTGAEFPSLQWGDVIEVLSSTRDARPSGSSTTWTNGTVGLPPETLAILRATQSVRITFKTGDFTRELTLRGALRVYDPTTTEAPLISAGRLVSLIAGDIPGEAKIQRSSARGESTVEWRTCLNSDLALTLPLEGDVITFTPEPDPNNGNLRLRIPGHPGRWDNTSLDQEPTLLQFLADFYPPLRYQEVLPSGSGIPLASDLKALTADGVLSHLVQTGSPVPVRPFLPWPDWSSVKVRRAVFKDGPSGEKQFAGFSDPETINLAASMTALPANAPPDDARKLDVPLHPGDEVELPLLKDHPAGPWPGFDEAAIRFFQKALTAKITVTDGAGRSDRITLQWLPPRWLPTPAGVLPVPDGDATNGRVHWLRAGDFADSIGPGLRVQELIRDGENLGNGRDVSDFFLRRGDILLVRPGEAPVPQ